jgi:hypothetical protein
MSETKTVLGRVFTRSRGLWECNVGDGVLEVWEQEDLDVPDDCRFGASLAIDVGVVAVACGPTESDAILALQSTLRKMAELEVAGG